MLALIIIDQQKGIDHPKLGKRNNANAENEILKLLTLWRNEAWPIVHVRHRSSSPESVFWPEHEGYDFKKKFTPLPNEIVIEKSVPCAFINSTLEEELRKRSILDIVLVGVATNNSVESTARTSGNLGFNTTVVNNACFTFAKIDFNGDQRTAEEVHAMSLANLDGEYAAVVNSSQLMRTLER